MAISNLGLGLGGRRPHDPSAIVSQYNVLFVAAKKGRYSHAKRVETVRATTQYWMNQQSTEEQINDPDDSTKNERDSTTGRPNLSDGMLMHMKEELPYGREYGNRLENSINDSHPSCSTNFSVQSFERQLSEASQQITDPAAGIGEVNFSGNFRSDDDPKVGANDRDSGGLSSDDLINQFKNQNHCEDRG